MRGLPFARIRVTHGTASWLRRFFPWRQREQDRARPGPSLFACLVSFCRFRAPERPSRERADRMTNSQETLDQGISNVETEYLEINSKGAWPILYQVKRSRPVPSLSSSVFCVFPSGSSEKRRFLPVNVSRTEPSYTTASNFQSGVFLPNSNHHYC